MEDTLRGNEITTYPHTISCLNPCCNGRYSQRNEEFRKMPNISDVLILVVMEDTLRVSDFDLKDVVTFKS